MISQDRLRTLARELGVRQGYAEKNYVNSWLLWGIFTSDYGDNLLFKGGTALSKLYFPRSWRYSEDLDFGVAGRYQGSKTELRALLDTVRGILSLLPRGL
jgi:predicted nucleotidyltransferase component of viral defense system